jgi:imidazolonepropionase-like amidohydrolase
MFRAGVGVLAGTDAHGPFNVPGFSLHDDLELFVRGGLTPHEALETATTAPARFLGQNDASGRVAEGGLADLLMLDANPLESVSHTRRIAAVVADGRYYDRATLDGLLADAQTAARMFKPRR